MSLNLLRFDDMKSIGEKRIVFTSIAPHVPKREVSPDGDRIYAIYKHGSGYYVVYETNNVDFYRAYRAESVPSDAQIVDRLEVKVLKCAICGARIEWDADEPYCPVEPEEHFEFKEESILVYQAKQFDWSMVERGPPETINVVITAENASYVAKQILRRYGVPPDKVEFGYIAAAGYYTVKFVKTYRKETVVSDKVEVVEGVGYVEGSSWEEAPQVYGIGYYIAAFVITGHGVTTVAFAKIRDLADEDIDAFIETNKLHIVEKFFGREKIAEALKRNVHKIPDNNVAIGVLAKYGLIEEFRAKLLRWLDSCDNATCLDIIMSMALNTGVVDENFKAKCLEAIRNLRSYELRDP